MVIATARSLNSSYTHAPPSQAGRGFVDNARKVYNTGVSANNFAKKNKIVTKSMGVVTALGGDRFLNEKTGGVYGKVGNFAVSRGYGHKKRRVTRR